MRTLYWTAGIFGLFAVGLALKSGYWDAMTTGCLVFAICNIVSAFKEDTPCK